MEQISYSVKDETLTIFLGRRIDASNAPQVEAEIQKAREAAPGMAVIIDAEKLEYISSAGLRVLLRLRKETNQLTMINVSLEVYEVLDMTGFTEMIHVKKAYRHFYVEGCELIG